LEYVNKLTSGQKLIVGSGILMFIASFLPWHKYDFGIVTENRSAWQSPDTIWSLLAVLISIAMVGVVLAVVFGNVTLPDLGQFTWGQAALASGALTLVLVIIKFLATTNHLGFGFFLGFIAAVGLAAGGYLRYTEEGAGGVKPA
jgi:hypothetical protein